MEEIIKCAIKGGLDDTTISANSEGDVDEYKLVCDPLFWQALGKSCGWENLCADCIDGKGRYCSKGWHDPETKGLWKYNALKFHEINLTRGFGKATEWLLEQIKLTNLN